MWMNYSFIARSLFSGLQAIDDIEYVRRATHALAFRLILTGRAELIHQAGKLLSSGTRYNTPNTYGMTVLMIASLRNDENVIQQLLDCNVDPNACVPLIGTNSNCPNIHPDTQHWTAITFAACKGNFNAVRLLLEHGANVEGGASMSDDASTLTPLQVSSGSGAIDIVSLLLSHDAHAFRSTHHKDGIQCFSGAAQRGCYSSISVAASHNQRSILRKLLAQPAQPDSSEKLSLEEMLAEGDTTMPRSRAERRSDMPFSLTKSQIKCLQEAMYHSAENHNLGKTAIRLKDKNTLLYYDCMVSLRVKVFSSLIFFHEFCP